MLCVVASQALQHKDLRRTRHFSDFFNTLLDNWSKAFLNPHSVKTAPLEKLKSSVKDPNFRKHWQKYQDTLKLIADSNVFNLPTTNSFLEIRAKIQEQMDTKVYHRYSQRPNSLLGSL